MKEVLAFEMGGESDYRVMQGHVQEETVLSNTAVKSQN